MQVLFFLYFPLKGQNININMLHQLEVERGLENKLQIDPQQKLRLFKTLKCPTFAIFSNVLKTSP